jgi:hypothetical protein
MGLVLFAALLPILAVSDKFLFTKKARSQLRHYTRTPKTQKPEAFSNGLGYLI